MERKIVLFSYRDDTMNAECAEQLSQVFAGYAQVQTVNKAEDLFLFRDDLIVTVTYAGAQIVFNCWNQDMREEPVILNTSYTKAGLEKLKKIPKGTRAALKSHELNYSRECIEILRRMGITEIEMEPFCGEVGGAPEFLKDREVDTLIYHDEQDLDEADKSFTHRICIGNRRIIADSYYEIAQKLGIEKERIRLRVEAVTEGIADVSWAGVGAMIHTFGYQNNMKLLLDVIPFGILFFDNRGVINMCNTKAAELLSVNAADAVDRNISHIPPIADLVEHVKKSLLDNNIIYESETVDKALILQKKDVSYMGYPYMSIIFMEEYKDMARKMSGKQAEYLNAKYTFDNIIGGSRAIAETIEYAKKCAQIDSPVLILGETGTGKELYAHAIHNDSVRRDSPFIPINCTAIPDELLESELFGYEQGSFTGASSHGKKGLFQIADGGTIFLDEIGDASSRFQMKLLRVLQEGEIIRVGSYKRTPVDVRIIASTNKSLEVLKNSPTFRSDIFYRLSTCVLEIPALPSRREDIPSLAKSFLAEIGCSHKTLSPQLLQFLTKYRWKGNVRELKSCVEQMGYFGGAWITLDDLPLVYRDAGRNEEVKAADSEEELISREQKLEDMILTVLREKNCGRRALTEQLNRRGISVTEHEVRMRLQRMAEQGMILKQRGRNGCKLNKWEETGENP